MSVLFMFLLWAGAVFFALAALGVSSRFNLLAVGLLCWIMVPLIQVTDTVF